MVDDGKSSVEEYKGNPVGAIRNLAQQVKWPQPRFEVQQQSCGGWAGQLSIGNRSFAMKRVYATIRGLEEALALTAYPAVFGFEYPPPE